MLPPLPPVTFPCRRLCFALMGIQIILSGLCSTPFTGFTLLQMWGRKLPLWGTNYFKLRLLPEEFLEEEEGGYLELFSSVCGCGLSPRDKSEQI